MVRPIWTGSLAFGLVNVPVALYSATEDKTVHFNQFQAGTSDRIRYKRVNERTGQEVGPAGIVRGREIGDGDYVLVSDEELEAVEPGRSRTIDITDFVDLDEIDPVFFQRTYYLAPRGEGAERAYDLLHQAMASTGKAGIATFVMRGKQYLVVVRPREDALALETMHFADEVRDPREEIDHLPATHRFAQRELSIARQLIGSMTAPWQPEDYRDTYREQVEDLIERKRQGEEIVTEHPPQEDSGVTDLIEALRRSAEAARGRARGGIPSSAGDHGTGPETGTGPGTGRGTGPGTGRGKRRGTAGRSRAVHSRERQRGKASGDDDLSALSKRELAEMAGRLDIPRRSKMDRGELETAIRDAQDRARHPAAS